MASHDTSNSAQSGTDKPYHSKRPHRKSRAGCRNCKTRKVKCDEVRPSCRACTLRKEKCNYPTPSSSSSVSPRSETASLVLRRSQDRHGSADSNANKDRVEPAEMLLLKEPLFSPADTDAIDMKLIWFYTTNTYQSFSTNANNKHAVQDVLKVKLVQIAFQTPFLMHTLLGMTALHMKYLGVPVPEARAIAYRAQAFEGYRKAIEEAKPETYPALLACSLLLCAVATSSFREGDAKPLYVLDWILVWRGIGLIIELVKAEILFKSGMESLFYRPPIDLDASALHIPGNLLFMVSSLKAGDEDFPNVQVYYDTLKYLGALYKELEIGFGSILDLRVITFFTFLPRDFIDLARSRRPRALVIVAHYLAFVKCVTGPWWMVGIADREIENVCNLLDSDDPENTNEWTSLIRVPRAVSRLADQAEVAKVLLGNYSWSPSDRLLGRDTDGRTRELAWVDDTGKEIAYRGEFVYQIPTREKPKFNTHGQREVGFFRSGAQLPDDDEEYLHLVGQARVAGLDSAETSRTSSTSVSP